MAAFVIKITMKKKLQPSYSPTENFMKPYHDSNTNSQTSFSLAACVRHEATQPVKFLATPLSVVTDVVATLSHRAWATNRVFPLTDSNRWPSATDGETEGRK